MIRIKTGDRIEDVCRRACAKALEINRAVVFEFNERQFEATPETDHAELLAYCQHILKSGDKPVAVVNSRKAMCPVCRHEFTDEEKRDRLDRFYRLCSDRDRTKVDCPSCKTEFWLQGDFIPIFSSAVNESDLPPCD